MQSCLNPAGHARVAGRLAAVMSISLPLLAQAGATLPFGEGESLSIGLGMRGSFSSTTNGAPNGSDRSSNFSLDNLRLYMGATLTPEIKAVFNTERDGTGRIQIIDGFAAFEFDPAFNVWAGRLLPPGDRNNMDGPFYQLAYDYPGVVSNFYSLEVGRDDGVAVWGRVADKKVVYGVGAFQGRNHGDAGAASGSTNTNAATSSNQKAHLLYSGRVAVNLLDPEPTPAYFEGSTYYGGAGTIFTITLAGMMQSDGVGTSTISSDYKVYDVDAMFELPIAGGSALDLLGAYYKYDYSVAAYQADVTKFGLAPPGKAFELQAGYLIGDKVGIGRFQPFVRYQKFDIDGGGSDKRTDIGVNYIIKGEDAKLSAFYVHDDQSGTGAASSNTFKIAFQLQF